MSTAAFDGYHDPPSAAPGDGPRRVIAAPPARAGASARPPVLAGRAREWAILREWLGAALAGRGSPALIAGEAGIGKTALARATLGAAAARGALVLAGHCHDLAETPPYGPWAELCGRAAAAPGLPPPPAAILRPGEADAAPSRAALFGRVRDWLAAAAARRPLVLLLEDLHWADAASLDLLRHLAPHLAALPILLLGTCRASQGADQPPAALAAAPGGAAGVPRLDLGPLDGDALAALVRARYPLPAADEARLVAYLGAGAAGNPFFVGELLRALEGAAILRRGAAGWALGDPAGFDPAPRPAAIVAARLAGLGEPVRRHLALAALIGPEAPLALWRRVAGCDEEALLESVERAVAAGVLEESGDGARVRFRHAPHRRALYEGIGVARRRCWHGRVGEALAELPVPDPDAVAGHFRRAGDARAVDWLVAAGERARRAYAWLAAAARFAEALALLDRHGADARERGWLLLRLALLRRYDDSRRAAGDLAEAARLAATAEDDALAAFARFYHGLLRCFAGEYRRGVADLEAGVAALDALPSSGRAAAAARGFPLEEGATAHHGTLAVYLAAIGRHADARAAALRAVGAGAAGRPPPADAHYALGLVYAVLGEPGEAAAAYAGARRAYQAAGNPYLAAVTATEELFWVLLPYGGERVLERRALAADAEAALAASEGVRAGLTPRVARLPLLLFQGGWAEARALALATRATASDAESFVPPGLLGALAYHQGDTDLAWSLVREALPEGSLTPPGGAIYVTALALQRLAAALARDAGDREGARAWLTTHDRWLDWGGAALGRAEGALGWARYHRAAGEPAAARARAEEALARATTPRQPLALLAARRLLGQLAAEAGRPDEAAGHLAAALALADACAAPYARARCLLALADLRRREGDRAAAGAALAEARAICAPLGAAPALAAADALAARLAAAAGPPPAYPAGLTAREVEVLRLVAAGRTNAQIADALCLSKKTVIHHVTHILDKTGADNRAAAAAFALRHGLA